MMDAGALTSIATDINREHDLAKRAAGEALEHARRCGELLAQAKAGIGHGNWAGWLEEHFTGSRRTAQVYMRIAGRWEELNAQRVAHLGIRATVRLLAEPRTADQAPAGDPWAHRTVESRREAFSRWWDLFAAYVLLRSEAGSSVPDIARSSGMPESDVQSILFPEIEAISFAHDPFVPIRIPTGHELEKDYVGAVEWATAKMLLDSVETALGWTERYRHPAEVRIGLERRLLSLRDRESRLEGCLHRLESWAMAFARLLRRDSKATVYGLAMGLIVWDGAREALGIESRSFPLGVTRSYFWQLHAWTREVATALKEDA